MSGEPFENYEPIDRQRIAAVLIELIDMRTKLSDASALVSLEQQAGSGSETMYGSLAMIRSQANAIEALASIQLHQVALMREMADIMERNNQVD